MRGPLGGASPGRGLAGARRRERWGPGNGPEASEGPWPGPAQAEAGAGRPLSPQGSRAALPGPERAASCFGAGATSQCSLLLCLSVNVLEVFCFFFNALLSLVVTPNLMLEVVLRHVLVSKKMKSKLQSRHFKFLQTVSCQWKSGV